MRRFPMAGREFLVEREAGSISPATNPSRKPGPHYNEVPAKERSLPQREHERVGVPSFWGNLDGLSDDDGFSIRSGAAQSLGKA